MLNRLVVSVVVAAVAGLVQSSPLSTQYDTRLSSSNRLSLAPLLQGATQPVENSYIIVLKDTIPEAAFAAHTNFVQNIHGQAQHSSRALSDVNGITNVYTDVIKGYAGYFASDTIDMIRARPEVEFVEVDKYVYASNITVQQDAPWVSTFGNVRIRLIIFPRRVSPVYLTGKSSN